jgi:DNA replication protein DnaC
MVEKMVEVCSLCDGSGLRILQENGRQVARPCECRIQRRAARMLERARIPRRYEGCRFDNFDSSFRGADKSLKTAHEMAKTFVEDYPHKTDGIGLLLTGDIGVGKTHLAVGILKELMKRHATGLFYDYRELLKEIQNTYNRDVTATELGILQPVFAADVLVLDELGASKPTEWVWDTVAQILNARYNDRRTTIITTNFPNERELPKAEARKLTDIQMAVRVETLGDRIGERMRSRLQEMCVVIQMDGKDFRQSVKRADFHSEAKQAISEFATELPVGPVVGHSPSGETTIGAPEPKHEEPSAGLIRKHAKKLAVTTSESPDAAKENSLSTPKVLVNGRLEEMITRDNASDGSLPCPDDAPIGRAKLGSKWATPQPKRVIETDWRKG